MFFDYTVPTQRFRSELSVCVTWQQCHEERKGGGVLDKSFIDYEEIIKHFTDV
jgi:hypothetical protein